MPNVPVCFTPLHSRAATEKTNVSEDKLRQFRSRSPAPNRTVRLLKSRYEIAKSAPPESVGDVLSDERSPIAGRTHRFAAPGSGTDLGLYAKR